jgi:hypothetical protein
MGKLADESLDKVIILAFLNARYLENDAGGERLAQRVSKIHKLEED